MNHQYIGPLYCETLLDSASAFSFLIEPINALTSLVPVILGVAGFLILKKWNLLRPELALVALLLAAVGVGSILWHGLRTPLTLVLDWVPGILALMLIAFLWPTYLKNRWLGYAIVPGIFLTQLALFPIFSHISQNGPPVSLFATIAIFGGVLIAFTFKKFGSVGWWGVAALLCALIAATARTVDLYMCDTIPFGTHFLWHIFLSTAAFWALIMLAKMKQHSLKLKS